ncbi:MAG: ribosomal protein L7/L12 [Bryobacterales bacterium]|nr:ribosomal protein L7/L12 [Acidobacteriota bacterium]MCB9385681.1 ribosomal protein L7/L12 [Bryobacterales bacterium]
MDEDLRRTIDARLANGEIDFEEHRKLLEALGAGEKSAPGDAFAVVLHAASPTSKIGTIKVVREATGLGLKQAKQLVEAAPALVAEGLDRAAAQALARNLSDIGARAEAVVAHARSLELPRAAALKAQAQASSGCLLLVAAVLIAAMLPAIAAALGS